MVYLNMSCKESEDSIHGLLTVLAFLKEHIYTSKKDKLGGVTVFPQTTEVIQRRNLAWFLVLSERLEKPEMEITMAGLRGKYLSRHD